MIVSKCTALLFAARSRTLHCSRRNCRRSVNAWSTTSSSHDDTTTVVLQPSRVIAICSSRFSTITTKNKNKNNNKEEPSSADPNGGNNTNATKKSSHHHHTHPYTEDPLMASKFQNPIVRILWKERQRAKDELLEQAGQQQQQQQQEAKNEQESSQKGKLVSQSATEINYEFSTNEYLRETYRSPSGRIRVGRILEDLDALAGNIAFYHVCGRPDDDNNNNNGPQQQPIIVTACVDRVRVRQGAVPSLEYDQHLYGKVTFVGTSSMEIRMVCRSVVNNNSDDTNDKHQPQNHNNNNEEEEEEEEWLEAYFTFVTLDPKTKKASRVPPLVLATAEEEKFFQYGKQRADLKKQRRKQQQNSGKNSSNDIQEQLARELFMEGQKCINLPTLVDPHTILMNATKIQNALLAQAQVRNLHNRIFGGYLMRQAFELAFANAYVFCGSRPTFLEVDEVSFTAPVDIGDLLIFNSRILYTSCSSSTNGNHHNNMDNEENEDQEKLGDASSILSSLTHNDDDENNNNTSKVHVEVETFVTEPETVDSKLSNKFYFTFTVPSSPQEGHRRQLRRVLPSNIDEARIIANRIISDRIQEYQDAKQQQEERQEQQQ